MRFTSLPFFLMILLCCQSKRNTSSLQSELDSIGLLRGEIALCGAGQSSFGSVNFNVSSSESVRADFNQALALLHSFEYAEAEKTFVKVIERDPQCAMAYWGIAMSNFHSLWAPPTNDELTKGYRVIALARTLNNVSPREKDYIEAIATIFDNWQTRTHKTRVQKFEEAMENIYQKYREDREAAVFYALALRAAADPSDKTFSKQKKAGMILTSLFPDQPDHPGIAHYLIHVYDYPELASLALPAARKYASIASASAHAQHMPSHIFTRLGLWDESIQSNLNSVDAARCYAENAGIEGHWDEELHGIDYLVYAYLQQGKDSLAKQQVDYIKSMKMVYPVNFKTAYTFAAVPARYALERKNWKEAAALARIPEGFPWENFPWERSIISFGRIMGWVHTKQLTEAKRELKQLEMNYAELARANRSYEANQVLIQIAESEAWINFYAGKKDEATRQMQEAADMEDATEKHPVTPGEVIPARELLADMLMEKGDYEKALLAYEEDLERHAGRFNALYGAVTAANKMGKPEAAKKFFTQLKSNARLSDRKRK